MRVLCPIVEPTVGLLASLIPDLAHRRPIRPKPIRNNRLRTTKSLHRFLQKPKSSLRISLLCDKCLEDFPFVINRPPEIVSFAVDPHKNLVQMPAPQIPAPLRQASH